MKANKARTKFFKGNGGLSIKQQMASTEGIVDRQRSRCTSWRKPHTASMQTECLAKGVKVQSKKVCYVMEESLPLRSQRR